MRYALGLRGETPPQSFANRSQPQRRRFVRDGEVPVTVIRRDHQPDGEQGANQLDAARQAIRSEATAKERAERLLAEAQAMIRDLQTNLGHERLSKNEALDTVRRLETEAGVAAHAQETVDAELAAERLSPSALPRMRLRRRWKPARRPRSGCGSQSLTGGVRSSPWRH
jgi:hypothetical protein